MRKSMWKRAAAALATVLVAVMVTPGATSASAQEPRVVDITAKRFAFEPSTVTLKKGETVRLRIRSEDVTHGFFQRQLKIDETIEPGQTAEVVLTPQAAGKFTTICDHFCGSGHGNMAMTIVVE